MQKMAKWCIVVFTSIIGGWIGSAFSSGSWMSVPSIILSIIGLAVGYYLARMLDNYIDG